MSAYDPGRFLARTGCPGYDQKDQQSDWQYCCKEKSQDANDLSTLLGKQEIYWHAIVMIVGVYRCKKTGWCQTHQYSINEIGAIFIEILIFFKCQSQANNRTKFANDCGQAVDSEKKLVINVDTETFEWFIIKWV